MSLHLLGAEPVPKAVLVRVRNPIEVAAARGGWKGAAAGAILPSLVEEQVLSGLAQELQKNLRANGVDAEVVLTTADGRPVVKSGFGGGLVAGAALVGVGWAAWRFVLRRFFIGT